MEKVKAFYHTVVYVLVAYILIKNIPLITHTTWASLMFTNYNEFKDYLNNYVMKIFEITIFILLVGENQLRILERETIQDYHHKVEKPDKIEAVVSENDTEINSQTEIRQTLEEALKEGGEFSPVALDGEFVKSLIKHLKYLLASKRMPEKTTFDQYENEIPEDCQVKKVLDSILKEE